MRTFLIRFLPDGKTCRVPENATLLDAARLAGVPLDAPCGGAGTCSQCRVTVQNGPLAGEVRACRTCVDYDMDVRVPPHAANPSSPCASHAANGAARLAAAFDIGTTTLVCYLLNADTGETRTVRAAQNPQRVYGADVITRAGYALEHGADALRDCLTACMNDLLAAACADAGSSCANVRTLCAVGNTCMHHILLGLPLEGLVRAPYAPAKRAAQTVLAARLGLNAHPGAYVYIPPVIAGFVGADTAACLLCSDFDRRSETTLLLDVGTNGEMALLHKGRIYVCSTAAGPAFEGGGISCGMRGEEGAVRGAQLDTGGRLALEVAGGGKPKGLCGSGLVSLAALLLQNGLLTPDGRLCGPPAAHTHSGTLSARLTGASGQNVFRFAHAIDAADGNPLDLTQQDVRALQLAKAAVQAGWQTLLAHAGATISDVSHVLLAGAFGSNLSPGAACAIGLLPQALLACVEPVGNAAGMGAVLLAAQPDAKARVEALAGHAEHVPLAADKAFEERFIDALAFPAPDEADAPC